MTHESLLLHCTLMCYLTDSLTHSTVACVKVSPDLCDDIARLRRKIKRISKSRTIFLDETAVRLSEADTHTIVLPGEQRYVIVEETASYSKRFDMITAVNGDKVFAPCIFAPQERKMYGAKGINTEMLIDHILNTLGQETAALDNPPLILLMDKSQVHNEQQILDAFRERGGHVMEVWKLPTNSAKRLSPLDNALFHEWKQAIRLHGPLTLQSIQQVMSDEWNKITKQQIQAYFHHCGLTCSTHPYADCPLPAAHAHDN